MNATARKGWFRIPGIQDGDRTIDDQMKGLGPLIDEIRAKPDVFEVLELGCAEGLILRRCLWAGARRVIGVEIVGDAVAEARIQVQSAQDRGRIYHADLDLRLPREFGRDADIVLALAVLHKLRRPDLAARSIATEIHPDLFVLRTPKATPGFVQDPRSGSIIFDVRSEFECSGYRLERVEAGHFDQWTGYFRRAA